MRLYVQKDSLTTVKKGPPAVHDLCTVVWQSGRQRRLAAWFTPQRTAFTRTMHATVCKWLCAVSPFMLRVEVPGSGSLLRVQCFSWAVIEWDILAGGLRERVICVILIHRYA